MLFIMQNFIKWLVFCHDFAPKFENGLENGIQIMYI